jgi:hypothetical protein
MKMKSENFDQLAFARRIRGAGRPVYIHQDDGEARYIPTEDLLVYQMGGTEESSVFDCGCIPGFKIHLTITFNTSMFAISRFDLELPWQQPNILWLEDPLVIDGPSRRYRFYGGDFLEFERHQVINHYADVRRTFSAGQSIQGFLLGTGSEPIPPAFPHGAMIPAFLHIYDQFWRQYRATVELRADRRSGIRRRGKLLDKRDPIEPASTASFYKK